MAHLGSGFSGLLPPIPINDIREINGDRKYEPEERELRCKLAAVFRVVEINGWSMGIPNHITTRLEEEDGEKFLINPSGLHYSEVTASCLHKIDLESGKIVDPGSTNFTYNRGLNLHAAVYRARPDINAVLHFHYPPCVAVSAMKQGLQFTSQEAAIVGGASYYDYKRLEIDRSEGEAMARNLGPVNKVLILRNHGIVTCGESLEEALYITTNLVLACETQIRHAHLPSSEIYTMSDQTAAKVNKAIRGVECMKLEQQNGGIQNGSTQNGYSKSLTNGHSQNGYHNGKHTAKMGGPKQTIWEQEFEIQMRLLDRAVNNKEF